MLTGPVFYSQKFSVFEMTITEIIGALFLVILIKHLLKLFSKPKNFPPGPSFVPVLGSYPFLKGNGIERMVNKEVTSYGPVTGLFAGNYPLVMINDWKLAKALFAKEEFSGRPR